MPTITSGIIILDPIKNVKYELKRFIGEGTFGEVWEAVDETDNSKSVAIKFYIPLDQEGRELFLREYENSSKLDHPNLLPSLFYSEWNRRPYIGMEFCEQGAVSKEIGNFTPKNEKDIWKFIHDTAAGLRYLHEEKEMVHQDIKPDNILINSKGDYVIMDFGISREARATLRSQSRRSTGAGAPAYMAPERFLANPQIIYASDIWSLGASIYELTMGILPFNGMGGGLMNAGAAIPSILEYGWSPGLNMVMQKCLSKDPWERKRACEIEAYADWVLCGKKGKCPWDEGRENPHSLIKVLVGIVSCGVFATLFSYFQVPSGEKDALREYHNYLSIVNECKDSIENGDKGNIDALIAAKQLNSQVLELENKYKYILPDKYTLSDSYSSGLNNKLSDASIAWANAADRQFAVTEDIDKALEFCSLAMQLEETNRAKEVYSKLISRSAYMKITNIEFSNSVDHDYSKPLKASTLKFLTPKISYNGLLDVPKDIDIYIKIYDPYGEIERNSSTSPSGYTYKYGMTIEPGDNNTEVLSGWGSSEGGSYSAGSYMFELWFNGYKIISKRLIIGE